MSNRYFDYSEKLTAYGGFARRSLLLTGVTIDTSILYLLITAAIRVSLIIDETETPCYESGIGLPGPVAYNP